MRLRLVGLALSVTFLGPVLAPPAWAADAPAPYAPPAGAAAPPAAAPVPAPAATPAAPAAATAVAIDPNDEVLRRVLRSGCRDGLPEVRALATGGGTSWAETVGRLCGEILASPQAAALPGQVLEAKPARRERDGRAAIVIGTALYGIWVGAAADVLLGIDDVRGVIIPPLLGMGAGLGLTLLVTADHPLDNGQSWTVLTGQHYGTLNGAMWAGGLDMSAKQVAGTALATGLASSAIGLLVADKMHPRQGDIEVVRSGLLWGTVTGMLGMAVVSPASSVTTFWRGAAVSMDLGFLAGLALASSFDVSRNRDLILDSGMLGGGFVGFGLTWLIAGTDNTGRSIAAGTLAGMYLGLLATIYVTRNMDKDDDPDEGSSVAALLGRDARGRWHWGSPGATPVMDGNGRRILGATLNLLGGTF